MLRFSLLLALASGFAFANGLECVVDHSGRGTARFNVISDGTYVVNTPFKSRVVVAARRWNHDCEGRVCYALVLGLVKSEAQADAFATAWQTGWGTWAEVKQRLSPFTTALASAIPVEFKRQAIGYGATLSVNLNKSTFLGGRAYEEASLSCRAK